MSKTMDIVIGGWNPKEYPHNELIPSLIVFVGFCAAVLVYKQFFHKPEVKQNIVCHKESEDTEFCSFYRKVK